MRLIIPIALLHCAACASTPNTRSIAERADLAFTHVNVVDVESGSVLLNQTVLISRDRIHSIEPSGAAPIPRSTWVVDGSGKYLIPGLWDMHTHLAEAGRTALSLLVVHGVTGARDMGADSLERLHRWRTEIAARTLVGPRIVASGPILDNPPPEPLGTMRLRVRITDGERGRHVVDSLFAAGVDFIKVYRSLSREAYFAVADQANRRSVRFAGHLPTVVSLVEASNAGQWTIEHAMEVPFPSDSAARARTFATLRENGTWFTPTLIMGERVSRIGDPDLMRDPRRRYVSPELAAFWEFIHGGIPKDVDPALLRAAYTSSLRSVQALNREQVPLLAGTDLGFVHVFPGSSVHEEMELLVRAGLTPLQALQAATINPARALATSDSLGTIQEGKRADLILLDANPLLDIRNTQQIRAVVLNGRYLGRSELDELLAEAEVKSR